MHGFDAFETIWPAKFAGRYTQLNEFIMQRMLKLLENSDARRRQIGSVDALKTYAASMRKNFIEKLGGIPKRDCPLNAKTVKVQDMGGYTLESIVFNSRKNVYVTASLYLPKNLKGPSGAVLFVPGHSDLARTAVLYQETCQMLVNAGLIVFSVDPTGQGERRNFYNRETGEDRRVGSTVDHDLSGIPSLCAGRFLEACFLGDQFAAVDYMLTRKEIDPEKIGVTGCSGGGLQSLCMMTCDDRIAAAAPAAFTSTKREILYTCQGQDSEQLWPGSAEYGFDHFEPYLIFAPKPAVILTVGSDFFPIEGAYEVYEEAKRIYALFGKEENLEIFEDDACHSYTPALAQKAAEFFCRVFGMERGEEKPLKALPEEEIFVTRSGNVNSEFLDSLSIPDETQILADALRKTRRSADAKAWLWERVNFGRLPNEPRPRVDNAQNDVKVGEYSGKSMMWWVQKRLSAYGVMIFSGESNHIPPKETVIALWDDGTKRIEEHAEWIKAQCAKNRQVLVVDLPGVGNIRQAEIWIKNAYKKVHCTMYKMCSDLMAMGDSMAAMQTYHLLRTIDMLKTVFRVPKVTLFCDEQEGVYGIMAGYLAGIGREYGKGLFTSVEAQLLNERPMEYDNTLSYVIPGMLEYFDYCEIMEVIH